MRPFDNTIPSDDTPRAPFTTDARAREEAETVQRLKLHADRQRAYEEAHKGDIVATIQERIHEDLLKEKGVSQEELEERLDYEIYRIEADGLTSQLKPWLVENNLLVVTSLHTQVLALEWFRRCLS